MLHRQGQADEQRTAIARSNASEEACLIGKIVTGDVQAFEALYRIYHPRLTRFVINIVRRPQLAEEAVNDTMLVVWRRAERYDGSCKVSTWIFAIAYRTALKAVSRHDEPQEDQHAEFRASAEAGPEQQLGQRQVQALVLNAMGQLSADHRAVMDLTYFHEAGYGEIAVIMDCPVGTVKTRMHHARRHLKAALGGRLADWL